jgi:hypothetical protein
MYGLARNADALLRDAVPAAALSRRSLLLLMVVCGSVYGGTMGAYGGLVGDRLPQVLFSAVKVPLLLLATFALSVPSFFVLNTLFGLRADFGRVLRALIAGQATLTIVLAAFAPYTAFWYICFRDHRVAVLFNGVIFASASFAGQWHLRRRYRCLAARDRRHRILLRVWLVIYVFVGVQMGWVLRPFVGGPSLPPQFLREGAWSNAYVAVGRLIWDVLAS